MSNLIQYGDSSSNRYFLPSDCVKMFPSSYRGYSQDISGTGAQNFDINLEAQLATEFNFRHVAPSFANGTYIKEISNTDGDATIFCFIGGYYFELTVGNIGGDFDNIEAKKLYITLRETDLIADNSNSEMTKEKTKTIRSWHKTGESNSATIYNTTLDFHDSIAGKDLFSGILFTKNALSNTELEAESYCLDLDSYGQNAVAFGAGSKANGTNAIAFGNATEASGQNAVAFGNTTKANSNNSVALGDHTIANGENQVVFGYYNNADNEKIEVVGAGSADNARKNIRTLDADGNEWLGANLNAGSLKARTTVSAAANTTGAEYGYTFQDGDGTTVARIAYDASTGVNIDKRVTATKGLTISEDLAVTGATQLEDSLVVTGTTQLEDNLTVNDFTQINANATITGALTANTLTTIQGISSKGPISWNYDSSAGDEKMIWSTPNNGGYWVNGAGNFIHKSRGNEDGFIMRGGNGTDGFIYYWETGALHVKSLYTASDKRLKENIIPFEYRKSILDIPVYRYNYKTDPNTKQIGIMAQDLQEYYPELVAEDSEGKLSVQESKLVFLLMEEIKQLKQEIEELKKEK